MTLDLVKPNLLDASTTGAAPPVGAADSSWRGLSAILAARAREEPDRTLFTALDRDGEVAEQRSAAALDLDVRRLAAVLRRIAGPGDRVLVPAMAGLDFHRAFLACLYGGLVAVPVPPIRVGGVRRRDVRGARRLGRLVAICEDAAPVAAVVPAAQRDDIAGVLADARAEHPRLASLHVVAATVEDEAEPWADGEDRLPGLGPVDPAAAAFLQYTSGSTSEPRGVIVTHGAMVANQRVIAERYALGRRTTVVSWLPLYHDMGLCAGLLQPLYAGGEGVVMEPETFLVRPQRWLEALSQREDAVSAAPDFAYLLAAARVTPASMATLDLRGWRMALCGAEPVQATTIRLFSDAFAECGLRGTALTPAYGLAESTLFVSGNDVGKPPFVQRYDREALGRGLARRTDDPRSVELVGAGHEGPGIRVEVVDPATHTRCEDGHVGELWVRSESNGNGYWGRPEESDSVFGAVLTDAPGERWLRTGDLGFRDHGELVVTGRLKDLVIIRGVNYYPQDFERMAQYAHPALWSGLAAAFVGDDDRERVRIVVEAAPRTPTEELAEAAAEAGRAVTLELPVQVEVLVVERGQVPRTTSGKVRRKECAMRIGQVEVLARWPRHE